MNQRHIWAMCSVHISLVSQSINDAYAVLYVSLVWWEYTLALYVSRLPRAPVVALFQLYTTPKICSSNLGDTANMYIDELLGREGGGGGVFTQVNLARWTPRRVFVSRLLSSRCRNSRNGRFLSWGNFWSLVSHLDSQCFHNFRFKFNSHVFALSFEPASEGNSCWSFLVPRSGRGGEEE